MSRPPVRTSRSAASRPATAPLGAARFAPLSLACALLTGALVPHGVRAQCPVSSVPTAGLPLAGAEFGTSVAAADGVVVIGAPAWAPTGGAPEGAVVVSVWTGTSWVSSFLARPASIGPGDRFGQDVAVNEDASVIAVGAPLHDGAAVDGGKLAIYEWDPLLSTWTLRVEYDGIFVSGLFGWSVAASGSRVAVGEPTGLFAYGTVNVLRRTAPGVWANDGSLLGDEAFAGFGFDVALSGTRLAVGIPLDDRGALVDAGAAAVFEHDGSGWTLLERLENKNFPDESAGFYGWSVALHGDDLAIGRPGQTPDSPGGRATVYHWEGAYQWRLSTWGGGLPWRIGASTALAEGRHALGGPGWDAPGADSGYVAVHQYQTDEHWVVPGTFLEGDPTQAGAQFGFALALTGERLVVGAPFADVGGLANAGRVTAYDVRPRVGVIDLGHALPGWSGSAPRIDADSGICGAREQWIAVRDARPLAPVFLVLGALAEPLPFKGGVFVPRPDIVLPLGGTSAFGELPLDFELPAGLPAYSLWWQFWLKDADGPWGFAATNAVRCDYPPY